MQHFTETACYRFLNIVLQIASCNITFTQTLIFHPQLRYCCCKLSSSTMPLRHVTNLLQTQRQTQTNRQVERQKDKTTDRYTYRQIYKQTDTCGQTKTTGIKPDKMKTQAQRWKNRLNIRNKRMKNPFQLLFLVHTNQSKNSMVISLF